MSFAPYERPSFCHAPELEDGVGYSTHGRPNACIQARCSPSRAYGGRLIGTRVPLGFPGHRSPLPQSLTIPLQLLPPRSTSSWPKSPGLLFLLLAACAGPGPKALTPDLPLPAEWTAPLGEDPDAPFQFLEQLGDPLLEGLIIEALGQNQTLLAAAQRLEAVVAAGVISRAGLYPSVQGALDFQRNRRNYIGLPIPGIGGSVLTSTTSSWNAGLSAAWEVDLWGRVRAGARAADADSHAAGVEFEGARLSLAGQVCRAWFTLLEARQQVQLGEETLAAWETSEQWARTRFEAGVGAALDLRLTAGNAARAQAVLIEARGAQDLAARAMEVLLGRYPSGELKAAAAFPNLPQALPAGVPAELLSRRPDLQAARAQAEAAAARSEMARADLYPRLSLNASMGASSDEPGDLTDSDFGVWSLATNLARPIFDGGRLRAGVKIQDAQTRAVLADWAALVLRACGEVESALVRCEHVDARLGALQRMRDEFMEAERLAQEQYTHGLVGIVVVLDARRGRLVAEAELLHTRRAALETRLDLWLALGGTGPEEQLNVLLEDPTRDQP